MDDKKGLIRKIEEKESQLYKAEQESNAWNNSKYKNSSNASLSKTFVESLRKGIAKLRQELESI